TLTVTQHGDIAAGEDVAGRQDWLATDVLIDANGLAVAHFILRLAAAADDLFRWNAINSFRPRPHEFDSAAGDDEGLEAIRAQVGQQFDHWLINALDERHFEFRMFRGREPVLDDLLKFRRGHARVRGHDELQERVVLTGERSFQITLEQRGERFL